MRSNHSFVMFRFQSAKTKVCQGLGLTRTLYFS